MDDRPTKTTERAQWNDIDMTETEWLQGSDPAAMLKFLLHASLISPSDRRLRLYACACCRRIWNALPDPSHRDLVAAVEDHPDGSFDNPILQNAIVALSRREREFVADNAFRAVKFLGRSFYKVRALDSAFMVPKYAALGVCDERENKSEETAQATLLRDVFGNPFRPLPTVDPAWSVANNGTVERTAQVIYDQRDFAQMPMLADALEQAGCTTRELLEHCRGNGTHVRGCWVLDLMLDKE